MGAGCSSEGVGGEAEDEEEEEEEGGEAFVDGKLSSIGSTCVTGVSQRPLLRLNAVTYRATSTASPPTSPPRLAAYPRPHTPRVSSPCDPTAGSRRRTGLDR